MTVINADVIAEIRRRAGILEVVSEFVVLKRAGKDYKGLCPFHNEKSPSFFVNPEKGIFKCFGCGEGGDSFTFVQKIRRTDFLDAVKELAHKTGIVIPETTTEKNEYDRRSHILALNQKAAEYYMRLLHDPSVGALARDYLHRRGLNEETIHRFKLGFATSSWDGLLRYLSLEEKASPDLLVEAGLVRKKAETGNYYDLFRSRLVVPIQDDQGRVIAFGGRTLVDDQIKYLNSPESPAYTKGEHLFGLHLAKDAIKTTDSVIVVEGYFDAITAHQFGFRQTVATLGTALTERQAKLLVRYTDSKRVYLCFDTDSAGEKAVERGKETLRQVAEGVGIELRVMRVPGGKDPDECLRSQEGSGGPAIFANCIASAPLLLDYELEQVLAACNLTSHMGRIEAARSVVPVLAQISNAVGRGEYVRQTAIRLGIREEDLLADVAAYRKKSRLGLREPLSSRLPRQAALPAGKMRSGAVEAERQLLSLSLSARDDFEQIMPGLQYEMFTDAVNQRVKEAMLAVGKFNNPADLHCLLMDRLGPDPEAHKLLVDLILKSEEMRKQGLSTNIVIREARARILQERLEQQKTRLRTLMNRVDDAEQVKLQSKIMQLRQLESVVLLHSKSDEELEQLKRKIDALLVETTSEQESRR